MTHPYDKFPIGLSLREHLEVFQLGITHYAAELSDGTPAAVAALAIQTQLCELLEFVDRERAFYSPGSGPGSWCTAVLAGVIPGTRKPAVSVRIMLGDEVLAAPVYEVAAARAIADGIYSAITTAENQAAKE